MHDAVETKISKKKINRKIRLFKCLNDNVDLS